MRSKAAVFLFFISAVVHSASVVGAYPVIRVDGVVVTSSPVVREASATITISTAYQNGSIFYTLDDTEPSGASTRYSSAFTITSTKTIRALAYSIDFSESRQSDTIVVQIDPPVPLVTLGLFGGGGKILADPLPTDGKFRSNTVVQLIAVPNSGWTFMNWTVALSGTANPTSLLLDGNKTVFAVFGTMVNALPPEHGRFASNYDLSQLIPANSIVSVTAVPDDGFYFAAWGGILSGSSNPSGFSMVSANPTISALFLELPDNKVTLSAYSENAGGRVAINNPANLYDTGAKRLITATPIPGWSFTGWSGNLTGLQNPAEVTLDSSKIIVGHFAPGLTVTIRSTDGGTVSRAPNQFLYPANSTVQLEAHPQPGFTFAGWTGSYNSMENPLTVPVSTYSHSILARFNGPQKDSNWMFTVSSPYHPSYFGRGTEIAADSDHNAVVISTEHVAKIAQDGQTFWNIYLHPVPSGTPSDGAINQDVLIDRDGLIYVANSGFGPDNPTVAGISQLSPAGLIAREVNSGMLDRISLGLDGTIYAPSRAKPTSRYDPLVWPDIRWLEAFGSDGSSRWQFSEPNSTNIYSRPAIARDGRLYFSGIGPANAINCVSPGGQLLWNYPLEAAAVAPPWGPAMNHAPVLGQDAVYVIDVSGRLLALTRDGVFKWCFDAKEILMPPSIGDNGVLYCGSGSYGSINFYALNPDGSVRWVRTPGQAPYGIAAIGSDGSIYVTDRDSLHALDKNGHRLWNFYNASWSFDNGVYFASPIIAGNKIYTAHRTNLICLPANAFGPANSPWTMIDGSQFGDAQEQVFIPAPEIDLAALRLETDGFHLRIQGQPGATIRIYHSTNLETWILLHTETTVSGEVFFIHPADSLTPHFYQVSQ